MTTSGVCSPRCRSSSVLVAVANTTWPMASSERTSARRTGVLSSTSATMRDCVAGGAVFGAGVGGASACPGGSSMANIEPRPGLERTRICRPSKVAALATMARPRPLPLLRDWSPNCLNSSKMMSVRSAGMPMPLSQTSTQRLP